MTKLMVPKQKELSVPITQPLELTIQDLLLRQQKIETVVREVMRLDVDYGQIPGVEKRMLFQTGAQVLAQTFQFAPRYEMKRLEFEGGHVEFECFCNLFHMPTEKFWQGVGSATTLEPKYRYRRGEPESTGRPVPQQYWIQRRTNPNKALEMIGGRNYLVKKIDGVWMICTKSEELYEHPDPAEYYNTTRKMAAKRSFVHAVLTATAAGRVFSEEQLMEEDQEIDETPPQAAPRRERQAPAGSARQATTSASTPEAKTAKAALWQALNEAYDKARVPAELRKLTGRSSISELSEKEAQDALLWFEHGDGRGDEFELK